MIDRKELEKKVPYGYKSVIAKRAGVTNSCVSAYFSGLNNNIKVEVATLEILAELSQEKKRLMTLIL